MFCSAASSPSEVVVLPSFCRVAAMNTRGVVVFFSGTAGSCGEDTQGGGLTGAIASFTGQLLARARVKLPVLNRLDADDGGDAEDVVRIGTARNIRRGAVEAEEDLAVGVGPGDVLDQFAGDVAGVEVREDQHVGVTGHFARRKLAFRDFRNQRSVHL